MDTQVLSTRLKELNRAKGGPDTTAADTSRR
jgi:hypothetical protein